MDEKTEVHVREVAVPLCEEYFSAAFASVEELAPRWKECDFDVYSSQIVFARALFHFACFPLVLMIQVMYKRMPETAADNMLEEVLDMFTPVLVTQFLEIAELTDPKYKTAFRDEFVRVLENSIKAYCKDEHAKACSQFAWLLGNDLKELFTEEAEEVRKAAEISLPPMIEAYAQQVLPGYVKTANAFVDAATTS